MATPRRLTAQKSHHKYYNGQLYTWHLHVRYIDENKVMGFRWKNVILIEEYLKNMSNEYKNNIENPIPVIDAVHYTFRIHLYVPNLICV